MDKILYTGRGDTVQLGKELGKGGEGSVYEIPSHPKQVAKVYHQMPDKKKQEKVLFMAGSVDDQLVSYAAWPQESLHKGRGGPVVGFLMPKVTGRVPIHMLYSPAHRKQDYPQAGWDFLLFAARNTAAAFSTLHDHGHILGDVNQGNVMVGQDSKVILIDCDSFQIKTHKDVHLCEVGVSHFTPPELQGLPSFNGVKRTQNHDNFGLALLVFHLLFGGRHPYSGIAHAQHVGEALETDIKAFRFAYARDAQSRSISPPPNSIPISIVPDQLVSMFNVAFTEAGSSGGRPTAKDWLSALDGVRQHLRKCSAAGNHVYSDHLSSCPWCDLEKRHGIVYFLDLGTNYTATPSGFVLTKVWAVINAVQPPASVVIPDPASLKVSATPLPDGAGKGWAFFMQIVVVCFVISLITFAPKGIVIWGIGGLIGLAMAANIGSDARRTELNKRKAALDEATKEFAQLKAAAEKECSPEGFRFKKIELERLRDEYQRLAEVEKIEIDKLAATAQERQKQKFMERFFIDSASISGVGPAKKAALRSFGIETAADVTWSHVIAVKGFGQVLTRSVVDWRNSIERRFTFDPRTAVTESDKLAVTAKIAARRQVIEKAMSGGVSELQQYQRIASARYQSIQPRLEAAAQKVAQASADRSLIS